ncbi:ThiF family adenylyltransferase [uncultured Sulfitobacter sp.]|uniref:HesA/MoeB/ThiF family protein n=1 Tax=uncultured Sulfitobacter sp. TaxID=191468 RepID=UPI002610926A|nr:ThiF family adenylyltransferase [uncultured Sulfitobacter sp.]
MTDFTYDEFTTRNLGFVSEAEQKTLRDACVFVCGTGGMGGSAIMTLIRAGVERLILADLDAFEVSNLNRQLFATLDTVGQDKAQATRDQCLRINPQAQIEVLGADWCEDVDRLVSSCDVVINGTDDLGASLLLYRTAKKHNRAVIDAYASPLPSVYVTIPDSPMPEEWLCFPTIGTEWNAITSQMRSDAVMAEATHVMLHSSSRHYIDLDLAGEMVAGTRSRMSFAPMVVMAGTLMAGEALNIILKRSRGTDHRGWFLNTHRGKIERPKNKLITMVMKPLVRRALSKMINR